LQQPARRESKGQLSQCERRGSPRTLKTRIILPIQLHLFLVLLVSLSTPPSLPLVLLTIMSDDKKNEDYTIELGEQKGNGAFDAAPSQRMPAAAPQAAQLNSPVVAIFAYCGSSILMTTTNKYVLSGLDFNLNFFLLAVQVSSSTEYLTQHL
jgi:hypothetical protein